MNLREKCVLVGTRRELDVSGSRTTILTRIFPFRCHIGLWWNLDWWMVLEAGKPLDQRKREFCPCDVRLQLSQILMSKREISISFRALKVSSIDKIIFHLIQNLHGFRYGWKVLSNYLNVARVTYNDTIFYLSRKICQIVSYVDGKIMSTIYVKAQLCQILRKELFHHQI